MKLLFNKKKTNFIINIYLILGTIINFYNEMIIYLRYLDIRFYLIQKYI